LFLDEIGDMPTVLQVKLLRVLEERIVRPVGAARAVPVDVRIISATHRRLEDEMAAGRFREDLFYRLRVVPIHVAPLRERREDIEPLASHLLARVAARRGRALRLSPDALRCMIDAPWRGNVRELENALEYAVAVCRGQTILPEDLPAEICAGAVEAHWRPHVVNDSEPAARPLPAADGAAAAELRAILEAHRWHREEAAREMGISRSTLWRRMREAGLIH
jgi:DNA-binding NtrC family response regulator